MALVLICLSTIFHVNSTVSEDEENELFEILQMPEYNYDYVPYVQFRSSNGTDNTTVEISPVVVAAAAVIGVPIALAAIAPPPLPMFPPQGVPQPGAASGGGGALPATVLAVRKLRFIL